MTLATLILSAPAAAPVIPSPFGELGVAGVLAWVAVLVLRELGVGKPKADPAPAPASAPASAAAALSAEDRARLERIERLLAEMRDRAHLRPLEEALADIQGRVRRIDEALDSRNSTLLARELAELHALVSRILDGQRETSSTLARLGRRLRDFAHRRHSPPAA